MLESGESFLEYLNREFSGLSGHLMVAIVEESVKNPNNYKNLRKMLADDNAAAPVSGCCEFPPPRDTSAEGNARREGLISAYHVKLAAAVKLFNEYGFDADIEERLIGINEELLQLEGLHKSLKMYASQKGV